MITSYPIKDGENYLSNHLKKNDYWTEGEQEVVGHWFGKGAELLDLNSQNFEESFESLRKGLNPKTGKPLTPRAKKNRVAFHDIQLSAPKDVSNLTLIGGDERVREAWKQAVNSALEQLEHYAGTRRRKGKDFNSENFDQTGNIATAIFHHDSSRSLDPQLHAHAVTANISFHKKDDRWLALQPAEMLKASKHVRQYMYRDLADRLHKLGYETHSHSTSGFEIKGIEFLRERFSKRRFDIDAAIEQFEIEKGRKPTKKEIAVMVRETRSLKMAEISSAEVHKYQLQQLTKNEQKTIETLVQGTNGTTPALPLGNEKEAIEKAFDHVFERKSVSQESEILSEAYRLTQGNLEPSKLRACLNSHPDLLRNAENLEFTLKSIVEEETVSLQIVKQGKNRFFELGDTQNIEKALDAAEITFGVSQDEAKLAANKLAVNKDKIAVLIGDAGTGKTFLLKTVRDSHIAAGGQNFVALAPTGTARDQLKENSFETAETVQKFLVSEKWQNSVKGRVLMVDEAGMLSTKQMRKLLQIAENNNNRVILVGDTKQHESVERGSALKSLVDEGNINPARLSTVRRQEHDEHKRLARLLAGGKLIEGLDKAEEMGLVDHSKEEKQLLQSAALEYVDIIEKGESVTVVSPTWSEIKDFNEAARKEMKKRKLLGENEVTRNSVTSLSWTAAEKTSWHLYEKDMVFHFHRKTKFAEAGESLQFLEKKENGIIATNEAGKEFLISKKHRGCFDVGESNSIELAQGDKILFRGKADVVGKNNGETAIISNISQDGNITLDNGKELPANFTQFSYGHAVTSHKSQGQSVDHALVYMGNKGCKIANPRQWYVSNTRHKQTLRIFIADRTQLVKNLLRQDNNRKLAREYIKRSKLRTEHGAWRDLKAKPGLAASKARAEILESHLKWRTLVKGNSKTFDQRKKKIIRLKRKVHRAQLFQKFRNFLIKPTANSLKKSRTQHTNNDQHTLRRDRTRSL